MTRARDEMQVIREAVAGYLSAPTRSLILAALGKLPRHHTPDAGKPFRPWDEGHAWPGDERLTPSESPE